MGLSFSFLGIGGSAATPRPGPGLGLGDLPESCVAAVLSYLDPPQICRLVLLNRAIKAASSADFVWESKLPGNYKDVITRVFEEYDVFCEGLCKRDIYAWLCRDNPLDGGTKKVWLDKKTGKISMAVSWNGLAITGIDDRRYWNRVPTEESRSTGSKFECFWTSPCLFKFQSVAYLLQTWWFEVNGEIDFPFPTGSYSLFFRLQLGRAGKRFGRRVCNSEHVHGWDKKPARFQISTSDGQQATRQCYLKEPGKWIHYHAGDFSVRSSCKSMKVKFSMTQIDCTHKKGGLCVDSVVIYPIQRERECSVFSCDLSRHKKVYV